MPKVDEASIVTMKVIELFQLLNVTWDIDRSITNRNNSMFVSQSTANAQPMALIVSSTLKNVSRCYRQSEKKANLHSKCTRRHRHGPQQGRANTLPKTSKALNGVCLLKAVSHTAKFLLSTKPIALHLALDNIERVAAQPQRFTSQTTIGSDLQARNILSVHIVALCVLVHKVLERQEPHAVCLDLTQVGHSLATEDTAKHAHLGRELANAVQWSTVQATGTVWLGLETDTDVLDRAREDGISDTGETSGHVVLAIGQAGVGVFLLIESFKASARLVEGTELHANLRCC